MKTNYYSEVEGESGSGRETSDAANNVKGNEEGKRRCFDVSKF